MNLNATLFAQMVVFFVLAWFTMKFVWPPIIKAIDERTRKIAEGLDFSEKVKLKLADAEKDIKEKFKDAEVQINKKIIDSDRRALEIIESAKADATIEAEKILNSAREEASVEFLKLKDQLRKEVADIAVLGAERILKKEVNKQKHDDILRELEAQL